MVKNRTKGKARTLPAEPARKPTRLERTAYHEAGHAILYFEFRRKFRSVTIEPSDDEHFLGHVLHRRVKLKEYDWAESRTRTERQIMISLAGNAAESRLSGRNNHVGAGSDYTTACMWALEHCGPSDTASAYIAWLSLRVRDLLADPFLWKRVQAIAKALLERKTLSYEEAKVVIEATKADMRRLPAHLQKNAQCG